MSPCLVIRLQARRSNKTKKETGNAATNVRVAAAASPLAGKVYLEPTMAGEASTARHGLFAVGAVSRMANGYLAAATEAALIADGRAGIA